MLQRILQISIVICLLSLAALASSKVIQRESLQNYIDRMQQQGLDLAPASPGSLWTDNGRLSNIAADYRAARVGDLITIAVVQDVTASNSGDVSASRSFKSSAGIDSIAGRVKTAGVTSLFSPHSDETLAGKAQADTKSSLRTSLSGRVAAVLPSGMMVIEAERQLTMNNEKQTVLLRGLVRPGDVSPTNVVLSNAIGNLELELKGKGVISEANRRPTPWVRALLRVIGF